MQLTLVLSLSLTLSAANAAAILASRGSSSESLASSTATHTDKDVHASPSPAMDDSLLDKLAYVQKEETKSSPVSASPMASMRVVQSQMPSQSVQLLATVSSSISAAESTSASASASAGSHAQPLASGSEPDSDSSASSTSSESSTSNSVGAVPFTNIVAPPPPTAMASETHPYTGNPALGLVATASTPHDDANANANSLPQAATHTSGQPFKEIAHVSSAPEAPPKPPAVGVGALDDEPEPVEDSSGPIGRNICIGIFTFLTLAAVVTCFKDKLNGAYRRFRQHRNARETGAFVNPWTPMADQTDADSEKGVAVHSEKDEMLRQDRSPSARTSVYGSVVHPLSPGGPVSPAASSNYSPSVMYSRTVPTYNRWPNQAPPVSTESLASEMTDYGRFPMPPTHPDYRYGPYVAKPQPDQVYYR